MSIRSWASSQPAEGFRINLTPCLTIVTQTWGTFNAVFFLNPWIASEDPAQDLGVILMIHHCGEWQSPAYFMTGLSYHPHSTLPSADALVHSCKDETAGATEWLTSSQEITETGSWQQTIWLSDRWDTGSSSTNRSLLPGLIAYGGEIICPWVASRQRGEVMLAEMPQLCVVLLELTTQAQKAALFPSLRQKWSSALQVT